MNNHTQYDVYIYHDNCMDGLTAVAIALQVHLGQEEQPVTIPGAYNTPIDIESLRDKRVCFLDFSANQDTMLKILDVAKHVTVMDHHISVLKELSDINSDKFNYIYHSDLSGAQIAWDNFIGGPQPDFVKLIGDRDLWTKQYEDSDILNLALRVDKYDMDKIASLIRHILIYRAKYGVEINCSITEQIIARGRSYQTYHEMIVEQIASHAYPAVLDDGTPVMKVNCPMGFVSDVGAYLYNKQEQVAWMFTVTENVVHNSLRVHGDSSFDASVYAKSKGGGGHRCAAGFTTPIIGYNK